jgi:hypothetical protein
VTHLDDPGAPDDPAFVTLWEHVLDHWDDDRAHVAFLEHCRHTDQLLPAAVCYRKMNGEPRKSEQAERRLKAITALAMAKLDRAKSGEAVAKRQAGKLLIIIFFVSAAAGLLIFYSMR